MNSLDGLGAQSYIALVLMLNSSAGCWKSMVRHIWRGGVISAGPHNHMYGQTALIQQMLPYPKETSGNSLVPSGSSSGPFQHRWAISLPWAVWWWGGRIGLLIKLLFLWATISHMYNNTGLLYKAVVMTAMMWSDLRILSPVLFQSSFFSLVN